MQLYGYTGLCLRFRGAVQVADGKKRAGVLLLPVVFPVK